MNLDGVAVEHRRLAHDRLLANAWGWGLRTVESTAEPDSVVANWEYAPMPMAIDRPRNSVAPNACDPRKRRRRSRPNWTILPNV